MEHHVVYWGDNANRLITFPEGFIPPGVAVDIEQTGSEYLIHIIAFGNDAPDALNQIQREIDTLLAF